MQTTTVCAPLKHHIAELFYMYDSTSEWVTSTDLVGDFGLSRLARSSSVNEIYMAEEYPPGGTGLCSGHWLVFTDPVSNFTYEVSMINTTGL